MNVKTFSSRGQHAGVGVLFNGDSPKTKDAKAQQIGNRGAAATGIGEIVQNASYANGQTTQATIFLNHNNRKNPPTPNHNQNSAGPCVYNNNSNSEFVPIPNFSNLNFYAQPPAAHYDVCYQQVCVCVCYLCCVLM